MASKELEKISSRTSKLEQKVFRRTQDPGEPTDYGPWEGAEDSQYRAPSTQVTSFPLTSHASGASLLESLHFMFAHLVGVSICVQNLWSYLFQETLQLVSTLEFRFNKKKNETLSLVDEVSTQLNP
ncbi:MAG: hypothetical protein ACTSPB_18435 [Candidatus Thorarchaeota archaeon]